MGVVLDPGSHSSQAETPRPTEKLGPAGCSLAIALPMIIVTGLAATAASGEGLWYLPLFLSLFYVLAVMLFVDRTRRTQSVWKDQKSRRKPTDSRRTTLRLTPQDGRDDRVGRLGGGGTHIIGGLDGTYVLVMADNGLGVGFTGLYNQARDWARRFVDESPQEALREEILFDDITMIEIENCDVVISGSTQLRLADWYHRAEPSHRAQVHRLIERLGFEEQPPSSGVYRAVPKTDAQPEAA